MAVINHHTPTGIEQKPINTIPDADLIVVGAGPSGSLAAALASKTGLRVVLMEKENMPRNKPCGGLISFRALSLLPEDFLLPASMYFPVYKIKVQSGKRCAVHENKHSAGFVTDRAAFDQLLVNYARNCGAIFLSNHKTKAIKKAIINGKSVITVICRSEQGESTITSPYVIGAWGALGVPLSNEHSINKLPSLRGRAVVHVSPVRSHQHNYETAAFFPLPFLGGMGWHFNGPGFINQGVGGLASYSRLMRAFERLFPDSCHPLALKKWVLPFGGPLVNVHRGNVLLVGDAAGFVEPFSGEGIYNSFLSSHLAIKSICEATPDHETAGEMYQRLCNKAFRRTYFKALLTPLMLHTLNFLSPGFLSKRIAELMSSSTNQGFDINSGF